MQGLSNRSPMESGGPINLQAKAALEQKSGLEKLIDRAGAKLKSLYSGNIQKNHSSEINKPKEGKTQTPSSKGALNENQQTAINTLAGESILSSVMRGLATLKKSLQEHLSSKNKSPELNKSGPVVKGETTSSSATPEQVVNNIKSNGNDSQFAKLTSSEKKEVMESLLKDFIAPEGRQDPNIKAALLNPSTVVGKVFVTLCEKKMIGPEYAFCRDWSNFKNEPTNSELLQKIKKEHLGDTNLTAEEQKKLEKLDSKNIDKEAVNELDKLFNGRNNNVISMFKSAINEQLPTLTEADFNTK